VSTAWLSLGSNLDAEHHLRAAVAALRARFAGVRVSPVYRTPAVGFAGPDFLNCAVALTSDLDVHALDVWLHALEDAQGRRRDQPRYASRTLDIDIVFFDDLVLAGPGHLRLPRDELRHAFVLKPLLDLAPELRVPGDGRTLAQLWAMRADEPAPERIDLSLD
jgi:2-amino-4-hydroxy-6-hydroxymethyldihydropteridine diphosphokinase